MTNISWVQMNNIINRTNELRSNINTEFNTGLSKDFIEASLVKTGFIFRRRTFFKV